MLPDISDPEKMAFVGRMSTLMSARRKAAKKLRDLLVPMLNAIEMEGNTWNVIGVAELLDEIHQINKAIEELN